MSLAFILFLHTTAAYPSSFSQFHAFLFSGIMWNRDSVSDILGMHSDQSTVHLPILREIVAAFLFNSPSEPSKDSYRSVLLSVLTGPVSPEGGTAGAQKVADFPDFTARKQHMATEQWLWSLVMSADPIAEVPAPPKARISENLKHYRKVLTEANWRLRDGVGESRSALEVAGVAGGAVEEAVDLHAEEYFASLNLLCLVCKTIILAYNALEKEKEKGNSKASVDKSSVMVNTLASAGAPLTMGSLLAELHPGTRSDLANAYLEALEGCHRAWCRRYDGLQYNIRDIEEEHPSDMSYSVDFLTIEKNRKLLLNLQQGPLKQDRPCMPAAEIFRSITSTLNISVESSFSQAFAANYLVKHNNNQST